MGKFAIKKVNTGYHFNLVANNGLNICTSQVYADLSGAKNGIESIRTNAPIAEVEDQTKENFEVKPNPKFEVYTDKAGEFRFRLKAKNGQVIAASEGYASWSGLENGIESVRKNAVDSEVVMEEE